MATTAHGLVYPDDYSGKADVPTILEQFALSIETAMAAMDTAMASMTSQFYAAAPLGSMILWPTATAPSGWKVCDGTAHGNPTLQALIGSPNVPDMRDRFPVGAGGAYAVGVTGGVASVTLTGAQSGLRAHGHGTLTTSVEDSTHTHSGNTGGMSANSTHSHPVTGTTDTESAHTHATVVNEGTFDAGSTDGPYIDTVGSSDGGSRVVGTTGSAGGHAHAVTGTAASTSITHTHPFTSGNQSSYHQHTLAVGTSTAVAAVEATEAHENRPPYRGVTFIMKVI